MGVFLVSRVLTPPRRSLTQRARQFAIEVTRRLQEAGFQALWAGGCVRDELLGVEPKDFDVATNAAPDRIRKLFRPERTLAIGAAFGVITVIGPREAGNIEVATFRSDGKYSDGRRPDDVTFGTAEEDALRRDFTINGLFFDPLAERILDFVGGQDDVNRGIVRAIGDARHRFSEDKLRMLRAVRFAATLDFQLEPRTEATIREKAAGIGIVSAERIAAEVARMLIDSRRVRAVRLLAETGLLTQPAVLPELAALIEDEVRFSQVLSQLAALDNPALPECLAILLGSVECDAAGVGQLSRRLRLSNDIRETLAWILEHRKTLENAGELPFSVVQPLVVDRRIDNALRYLTAKRTGSGYESAPIEVLRKLRASPESIRNPPPLIGGNDLRAMGLTQGPRFSIVLNTIRARQLDGFITTREQAFEAARELIDREK